MAYELLLTEDVESLGRKGQIVKARPGYARNFLLPQKLAVVATPHALRTQKRLQEEREKQAKIDRSESEELAAKITDLLLVTTAKVDQEGHMYGSVAAQDIVDLLKKEGITVDKKQVALKGALKSTGLHTLNFKLKEGVTAQTTLTIEPEGGVLKKEKEKETSQEA